MIADQIALHSVLLPSYIAGSGLDEASEGATSNFHKNTSTSTKFPTPEKTCATSAESGN